MSKLTLESTDTSDQADGAQAAHAEIVFGGRHVEIPDHFRVHVSEKLAHVERLDKSIYLFDVELNHEPNPRQRKACQRVEITARGRGPVVRGEACADNFYTALDSAVAKVEARLRRAKGRRTVHYGDKTPVSVAQATADTAELQAAFAPESVEAHRHAESGAPVAEVDDREPGRIVRVKDHPAQPMTVDEALYEMELVGHDFFLFFDKESERPSVVYRRHGYDYGLIRLA